VIGLIFLDEYTNQIMQKIYTSQNLCKLLLIDNDNPTAYSDIADTTILFTDKSNKRILTTPFNVDILDTQRSTLTINVGDARLDSDNIYFKEVKFKFFVLCPYLLWELTAANGVSAMRPNAIIHELLLLFNRKRTIGLGKNHFVRLSPIYPNQQVAGFILELEGHDFVLNG
jgi:hypothetical protein